MGDVEDLRSRAADGFFGRFGERPTVVSRAPGRVNLIGEHTDYNDGFVLPVAIDRYVVVAAAPAPDNSKVWSEGRDDPATFDAVTVRPTSGWGRFPAGCAWVLRAEGRSPTNLNAYVVSDLPTGAGLSSSAAIELAFLTVWNELDGLGLTPLGLATRGQKVEHEFVGVQCGIMDQAASALGREGCAMLLDTRSLSAEFVPMPEGVEIVVCDTKKPRALDNSAYNERRAQCEDAARRLGVPSLRDATLGMLEGTFPQGGEVVYSRARHVVSENERCVRFAEALKRGDFGEIGRLMRASHESLRDDYEVSCEELDWMAEACWSARGCVGARMTGAGFGGACVALVEPGRLDEFLGDAEKGYRDRSNGLVPGFLACRSAGGARVL